MRYAFARDAEALPESLSPPVIDFGLCTCPTGAVTANLRDMKARLNTTMHTFEVVVAALNVTNSRLKQEQASLVMPGTSLCFLSTRML